MNDPRYEAGLKVRREVLGDEHVDKALDNATEFTRPFQEYITRSAWGASSRRPTAARRSGWYWRRDFMYAPFTSSVVAFSATPSISKCEL